MFLDFWTLWLQTVFVVYFLFSKQFHSTYFMPRSGVGVGKSRGTNFQNDKWLEISQTEKIVCLLGENVQWEFKQHEGKPFIT